ncbi:flagellar basal-body rod protein FlgF [Teichococcus aestuarii]|uniref:flagellar basal-body rod protein FlgF n=1 Tax=Teichococcus aestuarii TaxID=568898 RepID=UPI003617C5A4
MDMPGYIVLSRLAAQRRATDALAANVANADTPAFKASQTVFATQLAGRDGAGALGGRPVAFAQDRATWRDFSPGPLQTTGNPLDLALTGEGFFAVQTPDGERYTRAGRFALSPEGGVVDAAGHAVLDAEGAPLLIPQGAARIEIAGDGTLATEAGPVGRLRVVNFANPQLLQAEGDRLYVAPPEAAPQPVERAAVVQGAVEGSNVRPVLELTRLTAELREFQFAAQFAEKEGERVQSAVERILRRR